VLADLMPPQDTGSSGSPGSPGSSGSHSSHGELLRRAYDLLEEPVDGLRLRDAGRWPEELLVRLRHLLDAYPEAALVATDERGAGRTGGADAADAVAATRCHLFVGPPPAGFADAAHPVSAWALPGHVSHLRACLLLALPGCHEIPHVVLASSDPNARALRALLAARAGQLALRYGGSEPVVTGEPRVTAVRRSHAGQTVLCLTNTADSPVAARLPESAALPGPSAAPDQEPEPELIEIAHDAPAPSPSSPGPEPGTVPLVDGTFTVLLGPGRTRWFRLRPVPDPRSPEAPDPFGPPVP
jgi:hypothetical protein